MPTFRYTARTHTGEVQTGVIEAGSQEAAIEILQQHRLIITRLLQESETAFGSRFRRSFFERISRKDILMFSRQISIMFEARVPLLESLSALASQMDNEAFSKMLRAIATDIDGGIPLSDALAKYPKVFSPFYVNMVRSGEASGKLQEVFIFLADYLERQYEIVSKIRGAFIYPAFILVVFGIVMVIMVTYVLPQMAEVFAAEGVKLPILTRLMLGSADLLRTSWFIWIPIVSAVIFFILRFLRTPHGHAWFHAHLLFVPIAGPLYRSMLLSRFADNLSTLIGAGIPILQALQITAAVVGNVVFQELLLKTVEAVQRGEKIYSILQTSRVMPPTVVQMVAVGERTGKLDAILRHIGNFYAKEVDRTTANLVSIIEPVVIVFLGVGVAIFVATILLPIYNLSLALS